VEAHTAADKQKFCVKAAEFREISREASQRGVRALAGYMPYGPADPDTGNIRAFLQPPDRNPALMMLEELGMGIIHLNTAQSSYYEWMGMWGGGPTMPATSTIMSSGETPVPYSPDFFLYEPRGALDFTSDSFAAAWPHPAVVAKQYASYPITTLHYSWRHATDILEVVGAKLSTAAKLDPTETDCTNVEVIDSEHHRTTGLAPGQYACWNPISYAMCQRTNWQPSPPPPSPSPLSDSASNIKDGGMDDGEVAGIAVGCLFVGLLIGAGAVFLRFKWNPIIKRHKSFEVDVAERRKEEEKL